MGNKPRSKEYRVVFDNESRMPIHPHLQDLLGGDREAAAQFFPEEDFTNLYRTKGDLVDVLGTAAEMEEIRVKILKRLDGE